MPYMSRWSDVLGQFCLCASFVANHNWVKLIRTFLRNLSCSQQVHWFIWHGVDW